MPVACVLIDHFPLKVEAEREPGLRKHPVIIYQKHGSQRSVLDVSPGIQDVLPGMPLQEAQASSKEAVLVEADVPLYQKAFSWILVRLEERSPVVEAAGLGCAYVGLNGLEGIYGSEGRLIDALLKAIPLHLETRLGVSESKFPAYLASLRAVPGGAYRTPVELRQFLASFPVEVLPVSWKVKERLHSFGLDTLGKVANLPLGPLQAQFGRVGARIWRLAQGIDDTPLLPQRPEEEFTESFTFPTPTAHMEPLLMAVDRLLARLLNRPEMRGRNARLALLEGHVLDKPTWQRRIVFKMPVGDRSRAYFVIKSVLESIALPGPLEDISLTLKELTGEVGRQESLFKDVRRREQLRQAIAQLKVSQGHNPIYQVREVEPWSRIPERQRALVTYDP